MTNCTINEATKVYVAFMPFSDLYLDEAVREIFRDRALMDELGLVGEQFFCSPRRNREQKVLFVATAQSFVNGSDSPASRAIDVALDLNQTAELLGHAIEKKSVLSIDRWMRTAKMEMGW